MILKSSDGFDLYIDEYLFFINNPVAFIKRLHATGVNKSYAVYVTIVCYKSKSVQDVHLTIDDASHRQICKWVEEHRQKSCETNFPVNDAKLDERPIIIE